MRSLLQIFLVTFTFILVSSVASTKNEHILVKRQSQPLPPRSPQRPFPLSRSRQFPPPEELDEIPAGDSSDDEDEPPPAAVNPPARRPASRFRGRQPVAPAEADDDDVSHTPAPQTTTPTPEKSTAAPGRVSRFGVNRPRLQINSQNQTPKPTPDTTSAKPPPSVSGNGVSVTRSRSRLSPRADVGLDILDKAPPSRSQNKPAASSIVADEKPPSNADATTRRTGTGRVRARGRLRTRTSSTTTTTTTTTTKAPPADDYYYYYYEDEEEALQNQPVATTTTTTTTRAPSLPRRPATGRRPTNSRPSGTRSSASTPRSAVKFDPESQFQPPPDDAEETLSTERSTRKFTTSTTAAPGPGGIPAHLAHKYKPRKDGRFIDYLRDPNRPRELKGFDLTDYPFYIKVPDDIAFDCEDKKDGYYASVPHHCQLFHYCFAGARYDFLCANYTLYDQTTFTCRFANNVDCPSSESYYYRNDDLWKETTTTSTSTTAAPEPKRKRKKDYDDDYEDEEEYDYEDEEDEEDEEDRPRPPKRRRNRGRKNRRKSS